MRTLVVCLATFAAACAARGPVSVFEAPAAKDAVATHYQGPVLFEAPGGRWVPIGAVLCKRTVIPSRGLILEEVINVDSRPDRAPKRFEVELRVQGRTFQLRERTGAFEGEGELTGPAWKWTAWRSTSRLRDGSRVESRDAADDLGGIRAEKHVYKADGTLAAHLIERLRSITAEEFRRFDSAFRPRPKP